MQDFYINETKHIALIYENRWHPIMWAVIGVYFFIAIGLYVFSLRSSSTPSEGCSKGIFFGFCTYGIYELTNIALLKNWPMDMALVDILWGPVLCGLSSYFSFILVKKFSFFKP